MRVEATSSFRGHAGSSLTPQTRVVRHRGHFSIIEVIASYGNTTRVSGSRRSVSVSGSAASAKVSSYAGVSSSFRRAQNATSQFRPSVRTPMHYCLPNRRNLACRMSARAGTSDLEASVRRYGAT